MKKGITSIVLGIFAAATMAVMAYVVQWFAGQMISMSHGDIPYDVVKIFLMLPKVFYGIAAFFLLCALLSTTLKFTNVLMLIVGIFCCVMALTIVPGIFAICAANSGNKAIDRAKNK